MDLIRCNATEISNCKWLTLTYADAMTDHEKVYENGIEKLAKSGELGLNDQDILEALITDLENAISLFN